MNDLDNIIFAPPEVPDPAQLREELEVWYDDLAAFARTVFPHRFTEAFTDLHYEIIDVLNDDSISKSVVCAFRGCGKTSLVALALAAREILFRKRRFIVYINTSETLAILQTENLRRELVTNPIIKSVFPPIKTKYFKGFEETFGKKCWIAGDYTMVLPRGSGQQVRGLLYRDCRPDLIIIDDVEDKSTIKSETQRSQRKIWYYGDVLKAVSRIDKDWRIIHIDTLKHEDSLMANLLEESNWKHVVVPICGPDLKSKASTFMTDEELQSEYEEHRRLGVLDVFAQEYMCRSMDEESALFKQEFFQYYDELSSDFISIKPRIFTVVLVDPAKTANPASCETAFAVWGVDQLSRRMYLRYCKGLKLSPEAQIDHALRLCDSFGARTLAVETTGLSEWVEHPYRNAISMSSRMIEFVELKAKSGRGELAGFEGGKDARIASMATYYRQGLVYHNKDGLEGYEMQLLTFPNSKYKDRIDAAAYIGQLLESKIIYMTPNNTEDFATPEHEYEKLANECEPPVWNNILLN